MAATARFRQLNINRAATAPIWKRAKMTAVNQLTPMRLEIATTLCFTAPPCWPYILNLTIPGLAVCKTCVISMASEVNVVNADQPQRAPGGIHHGQNRDLRRPPFHQFQRLAQAGLGIDRDGRGGHGVRRMQAANIVVLGQRAPQVAVGEEA